jgi:hypothetical protein
MNTRVIAVIAALAALGGGAVVASASRHASFASSATQDGPAGSGHFGGPPPASP